MSHALCNDISGQVSKHEQERNLKTYFMSCHEILLVYYFATWRLLSDMAKYFATSHPWFVTIVCLLLIDNNYNFFKMLKLVGIAYLKNIW
jgi:hypothetical protein